MGDKDDAVVKACSGAWEESWKTELGVNSGNCSGFFKSVARKLGINGVPNDVADTIVDQLTKAWTAVNSGVEARNMVRQGYFVGAGMQSSEMAPKPHKEHGKVMMKDGKPVMDAVKSGHLAVVVDGDLYHEKYPLCWCGSIGSAQSQGDSSIGEVFSISDRDKVHYFMYPSKVASESK